MTGIAVTRRAYAQIAGALHDVPHIARSARLK